MKALVALSVGIAVIVLSPVALAQTRVITAHAETASALGCLLEHRHKECGQSFVGNATRVAQPWLWWNPNLSFELGALVSSEYAGTQSANAYITKYLNGRTADVYDVKFRHQEQTFYIVPPGPDGNIHYMLIRQGAPNDEREDLFVHGPG
jgi:hypothetical protein